MSKKRNDSNGFALASRVLANSQKGAAQGALSASCAGDQQHRGRVWLVRVPAALYGAKRRGPPTLAAAAGDILDFGAAIIIRNLMTQHGLGARRRPRSTLTSRTYGVAPWVRRERCREERRGYGPCLGVVMVCLSYAPWTATGRSGYQRGDRLRWWDWSYAPARPTWVPRNHPGAAARRDRLLPRKNCRHRRKREGDTSKGAVCLAGVASCLDQTEFGAPLDPYQRG